MTDHPGPGGASLLFDLDGTLLDTDHLHLRAWNDVLASLGRPAIDAAFYRTRIMGYPNSAIGPTLMPEGDGAAQERMTDAKEDRFRALLGAGALEPLPGLLRLLDAAEAAGIPAAVVTNAPRPNAEAMLRGLGLTAQFRAIVIGDELPRAKPDPLPYLTAMHRLGASPARSIAFEDSASGMRAAAGSGALPVGVATSLDERALRAAGARLVIPDFNDPALASTLRHRLDLALA